jgi:hypothetical protein
MTGHERRLRSMASQSPGRSAGRSGSRRRRCSHRICEVIFRLFHHHCRIGAIRAADRGQSTSQPRAGRTQKSNSLKSVTKALLSLRWPSVYGSADRLLQGAGYSLEYPSITLTGQTDGEVSMTPASGRI